MSAATRSIPATGRPRISGRPGWGRRAVVAAGLALAAVVPATARADGEAATSAIAQNVSITIQLLWQVQQGCATRCTGTTQTQVASQRATTLQIAAATAPDGGGAAVAANTSAAIQLIVQNQLGCVAFCLGTSRLQEADQHADATQLATAIASALTSARNDAHVTQLVFQYQDACLQACTDVRAEQVITQAAAMVAGAGGSAGDGGAAIDAPADPPLPPELSSFTVWLATVAASATVDVVQQRDVADCLSDCTGDVQIQISLQETSTTQVSTAVLNIPAAAPTASLSASPAPGDDGAPAAVAASAAPARTRPAPVRAPRAHRTPSTADHHRRDPSWDVNEPSAGAPARFCSSACSRRSRSRPAPWRRRPASTSALRRRRRG